MLDRASSAGTVMTATPESVSDGTGQRTAIVPSAWVTAAPYRRPGGTSGRGRTSEAVVTFARICAGLVLCLAAACSARSDPRANEPPTTASSTTAAPTPEVVPVDAVWVLTDPDLTFVRIDHANVVPLGAGTDGRAPIVDGSQRNSEYRTPAGGAVLVEQAELVDPDATMADVIDPGGAGWPPTLTTIVGASRVAIAGPADDLRALADSLEPITPAALDEMVHAATSRIIDGGEAEPMVDGVSIHRAGDRVVACLDGEEPEGCGNVDHYGPLVMAPIPVGEGSTVVGCISQPTPIGEVTVGGVPVPTQTAPCGEAFSARGIAPGTLVIAFDDGPGGVGTYTFDLP